MLRDAASRTDACAVLSASHTLWQPIKVAVEACICRRRRIVLSQYERKAIMEWLASHDTSPMVRHEVVCLRPTLVMSCIPCTMPDSAPGCSVSCIWRVQSNTFDEPSLRLADECADAHKTAAAKQRCPLGNCGAARGGAP